MPKLRLLKSTPIKISGAKIVSRAKNQHVCPYCHKSPMLCKCGASAKKRGPRTVWTKAKNKKARKR